MNFKLRHILIFTFLFITNSLTAQYLYEWNDYYGGDAQDQLSSLANTFDGNIILAGSTKDSVDAMWLVKVSPSGQKLWSKLYTGYPLIQPIKVIETSDDNILVTGIVAEGDSVPHKIWLIKISPLGDILWEKLYSGQGDAYVADIVETSDKGLVIAGGTAPNAHEYTDWYMLKVDSLGNFMWDKSFGTNNEDMALSVDEMYDSTLIVVGYISYTYGGNKRATLSRFTKNGQDIWYDEIRDGSWSKATAVVATSDSSFVMTTTIKNTEQTGNEFINFDIKVMKMTPDGDTIWTNTLRDSLWEEPVNIIETFDQGYAIAFNSKSHGVFKTNIGVLKINPFGNIAWKRVFNRESDDYASQIIESEDNGIMVATSTYSIDKAWNFGVLKYKSIEQSDLYFITPYEPLLTVYNQKIPIDACIKGYKKPIDVKIYINRQLITTVTKFAIIPNETSDYSLQLDLDLKNGLNIVDFVVTDYKEFKFIKTKKIYYLPNATPHW
ncbi:MAG: hypothetical protein JXL97_06635 [Bacteroidales bacterium]|nr:hypothetical protein [Bacteroidales bacterium]